MAARLIDRRIRLDQYAREVVDARGLGGRDAVTQSLIHAFNREQPFCPSIAARMRYIYYGNDSHGNRLSVVKLACLLDDQIPAASFTLRSCDPPTHRLLLLETDQRKCDICRGGKLLVLDAYAFFHRLFDVVQLLLVAEPNKDVVVMAQHICEFNLCLRRNEIARTKTRVHIPSLSDFEVDGRCVVHKGASKGGKDHAVRDTFQKV